MQSKCLIVVESEGDCHHIAVANSDPIVDDVPLPCGALGSLAPPAQVVAANDNHSGAQLCRPHSAVSRIVWEGIVDYLIGVEDRIPRHRDVDQVLAHLEMIDPPPCLMQPTLRLKRSLACALRVLCVPSRALIQWEVAGFLTCPTHVRHLTVVYDVQICRQCRHPNLDPGAPTYPHTHMEAPYVRGALLSRGLASSEVPVPLYSVVEPDADHHALRVVASLEVAGSLTCLTQAPLRLRTCLALLPPLAPLSVLPLLHGTPLSPLFRPQPLPMPVRPLHRGVVK